MELLIPVEKVAPEPCRLNHYRQNPFGTHHLHLILGRLDLNLVVAAAADIYATPTILLHTCHQQGVHKHLGPIGTTARLIRH